MIVHLLSVMLIFFFVLCTVFLFLLDSIKLVKCVRRKIGTIISGSFSGPDTGHPQHPWLAVRYADSVRTGHTGRHAARHHPGGHEHGGRSHTLRPDPGSGRPAERALYTHRQHTFHDAHGNTW